MGKLRRLEEKDLRAFKVVKQRINRPTEAEMIAELRDAWEVFAAEKDGTKSVLWKNTERLWPHLFGREIDVRGEIFEPVLAELRKSLHSPEYIEELRIRFRL